MRTYVQILILAFTAAQLVTTQARAQVDRDRDGLLDLFDVQAFAPSAGEFDDRGIQDLDGATLLIDVGPTLSLSRNQITSIEYGDFDGLEYLATIVLSENRIARIESGTSMGCQG